MQRDQTPRKLRVRFINTSAYNENRKPQNWVSYPSSVTANRPSLRKKKESIEMKPFLCVIGKKKERKKEMPNCLADDFGRSGVQRGGFGPWRIAMGVGNAFLFLLCFGV